MLAILIKYGVFVSLSLLSGVLSLNMFLRLSKDVLLLGTISISLEFLKIFTLIKGNTLSELKKKLPKHTTENRDVFKAMIISYIFYVILAFMSIVASYGYTLVTLSKERSVQTVNRDIYNTRIKVIEEELKTIEDNIKDYESQISRFNNMLNNLKVEDNKKLFYDVDRKLNNCIKEKNNLLVKQSALRKELGELKVNVVSENAKEEGTSSMFYLISESIKPIIPFSTERLVMFVLLMLISFMIEAGIIITSPAIPIKSKYLFSIIGERLYYLKTQLDIALVKEDLEDKKIHKKLEKEIKENELNDDVIKEKKIVYKQRIPLDEVKNVVEEFNDTVKEISKSLNDNIENKITKTASNVIKKDENTEKPIVDVIKKVKTIKKDEINKRNSSENQINVKNENPIKNNDKRVKKEKTIKINDIVENKTEANINENNNLAKPNDDGNNDKSDVNNTETTVSNGKADENNNPIEDKIDTDNNKEITEDSKVENNEDSYDENTDETSNPQIEEPLKVSEIIPKEPMYPYRLGKTTPSVMNQFHTFLTHLFKDVDTKVRPYKLNDPYAVKNINPNLISAFLKRLKDLKGNINYPLIGEKKIGDEVFYVSFYTEDYIKNFCSEILGG